MAQENASLKPKMLPPQFGKIPEYFRNRQQWVVWKQELVNGRWTKVPYTPFGTKAMTNQPATWSTFAQVEAEYLSAKGKWDGIGYCRTGREMLFDLDGCTLPDGTFVRWDWGTDANGNPNPGPQPEEIVSRLENFCYLERSVSGTGMHGIGIGHGALPKSFQRNVPGESHAGYACYCASRFFTFTGESVYEGDLELDAMEPAAAIAAMFDSASPASMNQTAVDGLGVDSPQVEAQPVADVLRPQLVPDLPLADWEVVQIGMRDRKFATLWSGSWLGIGLKDESNSGADAALCQRLAFLTGKNPSQMDRVYRMSALYALPDRADKWESARGDGTYGSNTIDFAISITTDVYKRKAKRESKAAPRDEDAPPPKPDIASDGFAWTDLGNAMRFEAAYRDELRYLAPAKAWYAWTGTHWQRLEGPQIDPYANRIAQRMAHSPDANLRKHGIASQSHDKLRAMVNRAAGLDFQISADEFDSHPWLLNCLNGTLDLRTGELREHRREDFITHVVNADYKPEARSRIWDEFLASTLPDEEIRNFAQRAAGYTLTGSTKAEVCFLCVGEGRNGKGVFLMALGETLGTLGTTTNFQTFTRSHRDNTGDIADMRGRRLVVAQEASSGAVFSESVLKGLTGGDTVSAKRLYENPITFLPQMKIWLVTNHLPEVRDASQGFWSRMLIVPFTQNFAGKENQSLKTDLRTPEARMAILAWMVEGTRRWLEEGILPPQDVTKAITEYREETDYFQRWLDDQCEQDPEYTAKSRDLYRAYAAYCEDLNERPVTETAFGRRLRLAGFSKTRTKRGFVYNGLQSIDQAGV